MERISRTVAPNQDPKVRATNFDEVCLGFDGQMALREASRCLNCKNPRCVQACPVNINIPEFISHVATGDFAGAGEVIARDSSLPAICGRVCPQENQCEGSCVMGIKFEPVAIGQLERFVADWNREHSSEKKTELPPFNGHKVAIIGSGPAGLACACDLAKKGYKVTIFEALHKAGGVLQYGIPEF
ncbi:MAG: NAD(P)-binding protein, partial [Bacteroidales bacterium]|nr:NAD(P)-binding protein [Bacteroidales bacterium]